MTDRPYTRKLLTEAASELDNALADLNATVFTYELPNKYEAFANLLQKQKTAIANLLAGKPVGYTTEELQFSNRSIIDTPHLQNIEYLARHTKTLNESEQETFMGAWRIALHIIKNKATRTFDAYDAIEAFMKPAREAPNSRGGTSFGARQR